MEASWSKRARDIVDKATLEPIEHQVLHMFLEQAFDQELAGEYLISRVMPDNASPNTVEVRLRLFKQCWRAAVSKCMSIQAYQFTVAV